MNKLGTKEASEKGGRIRASRLTDSERSNEARNAVSSRWEKQRERDRLTAGVIAAARRTYDEMDSLERGEDHAKALRSTLDALDALL